MAAYAVVYVIISFLQKTKGEKFQSRAFANDLDLNLEGQGHILSFFINYPGVPQCDPYLAFVNLRAHCGNNGGGGVPDKINLMRPTVRYHDLIAFVLWPKTNGLRDIII